VDLLAFMVSGYPEFPSSSLTKGFLSLALMDTGASGSWFVWSGCTDPLCSGHASYTPSPTAYNFSIIDTQLYTDTAEEFDSWRMNDTLTYGNVSTPITFGAAFELPNSQSVDGNMGFAKTYFVGGPCAGFYTGFVEDAYLNGAIKNAVAAYYLVRVNFLSLYLYLEVANNILFIGPNSRRRSRSNWWYRQKQVHWCHRLVPHG
jgi:hypothetical protein